MSLIPDLRQWHSRWHIEVYQKKTSSLKHLFLNAWPVLHSFVDEVQANTFVLQHLLEHHVLTTVQQRPQIWNGDVTISIFIERIVFTILKYLCKTKVSYPLRQAIWSGKEHAPRFMSMFLVRHHLIISRLFNPTTLCKRLYPSSLCICKMFSPRGITLKSPSNRWTVTFGLAHSASKTILIFLLVWSETVRLWLDDSKAWPDWKKLERAPPILIPQQSVVICIFVLQKSLLAYLLLLQSTCTNREDYSVPTIVIYTFSTTFCPARFSSKIWFLQVTKHYVFKAETR